MSSLYVPVMQAARTLLAYGARPGTVDFSGDTALKHALRHGDADMVTLLLRKEMSDLSDRYKAPLMGAVEEVRTSCMCSYCHVRHTWLARCFGIPAKQVIGQSAMVVSRLFQSHVMYAQGGSCY